MPLLTTLAEVLADPSLAGVLGDLGASVGLPDVLAGGGGPLDAGAAGIGLAGTDAAPTGGDNGSWLDGIGRLWREINRRIIGLAGSPWGLLACFALAVIDGFFPPVPAETLVVATAAALSAAGTNWFVFVVLWLMVAAGAVCGDCVTYSLGRWFNAPSWRIFAGRRGQTALNWARRLFGRGAAVLLMVGRFIPVGRVAVNLTAGTIGYPMRRFVMIDSLAAVCWAAYSAGIGLVAGQVTRDNPLAAVVIGVTFSSLVGGLIQWLMNRHYGRQLEVSAGLVADTAEAGDGSENRSTAGPAEPE